MKNKSFLEYGKEYADLQGKPSAFVPFKKHVPHYRNLNANQLQYYLYLRESIRNGTPLTADDKETGKWPFNMWYLRLYFYELLNEIGVKDSTEAYQQMQLIIENTQDITGNPGSDGWGKRIEFAGFCKTHRLWAGEYLLVTQASRTQLLHHFNGFFKSNTPQWGGFPLRNLLIGRYPDLSPGELSAHAISRTGMYEPHFRNKAVTGDKHSAKHGDTFEKRVENHIVDHHIVNLFGQLDEYSVTKSGKHMFEASPHTLDEWMPFKGAIYERPLKPLKIWSRTDEEKRRERKLFKTILTMLNSGIRSANGLTGAGARSSLDNGLANVVADYLHEELGLPRKRCKTICFPKIVEMASKTKQQRRVTKKAISIETPKSVKTFLSDKSACMTGTCWTDLLSMDKPEGNERVLLVRKLQPSGKVSITKADWKRHFEGIKGFAAKKGDGVELIPCDAESRTIDLPDWALDQLDVKPKNSLCITEKLGKFFIKRLILESRDSLVPSQVVLDRFNSLSVTRTFTGIPDLSEITPKAIKELLEHMPAFDHDPLAQLKLRRDRLGFLARRDILGESIEVDTDWAEVRKKNIAAGQLSNGSWLDKSTTTAYSLISMAEIGVTDCDDSVGAGIDYLLKTPEMESLPGMFGISEGWTHRYNNAKKKDSYFRPGRSSAGDKTELEKYEGIVPTARDAWWPWITGTSILCLEALFRLGIHQHPRVQRALNTLVLNRDSSWDALFWKNVPLPTPPMTPKQCFEYWSVDDVLSGHTTVYWFEDSESLLAKVACGNNHHDFRVIGVTDTVSMLIRKVSSHCRISPAWYRTTSFHPDFAGSTRDLISSLEMSNLQNADGSWNKRPLVAFDILSRLQSPLASLLVLRSIPYLVRTQGEDGLWSNPRTTLAILRALKNHGFLEPILPK